MWWVMLGLTFAVTPIALLVSAKFPLLNGWSVLVSSVCAIVLVSQAAARTSLVVVDRARYFRDFEVQAVSPNPWEYRELMVADEPGFIAFLWGLARVVPDVSPSWLFGSVAVVLAVLLTVAYRVVLPWPGVALAWYTTLVMGQALAYSSVAVRHGLGLGLVLVAAALYVRSGKVTRLGLVLIVAGSLMHWSVIAFAAALLTVAYLRVPSRVLWGAWWAAVALFLLDAQTSILGPLARHLPKLEDYTSASVLANYGGGNRLLFLGSMLVLAVLAFVGGRVSRDDAQARLTRVFLVWSGIFLAFGFVAYSDRLAAWAWFLAPILLWRPLTAPTAASSVRPLAALGAVATITVVGSVNF